MAAKLGKTAHENYSKEMLSIGVRCYQVLTSSELLGGREI